MSALTMAKQRHHNCEVKAELWANSRPHLNNSKRQSHATIIRWDYGVLVFLWWPECEHLTSESQKIPFVASSHAHCNCVARLWAPLHSGWQEGLIVQQQSPVNGEPSITPGATVASVHATKAETAGPWSTVPLCRYNRNMGSGHSYRWCRTLSLPHEGFQMHQF